MKNVAVFAGAGASKAVNPDSYPTTVEFFAQLTTDVTSQPMYPTILEYAQQQLKKGAVLDIEVLLWHLNDLADALRRTTNTRNIFGWYLASSRLTKVFGKKTDFSNLVQAANEALPSIGGLVDAINRNVYRLYQRLPTTKELEGSWLPLLQGLASAGFSSELITTNYDLVLETALDTLTATTPLRGDAGWRGNITRELELDLWSRNQPFSTDLGLLTKLHGSVNWSRANDRIYISDPEYKGSDERHAIIYPGFKGRPSAPPFDVMHNYFGRVMLAADATIFVGFAFRDDYINDIVSRYLRKGTPVVVINPTTVASPLDSSTPVHPIEKYFNSDSATEAITWLEGRRGAA